MQCSPQALHTTQTRHCTTLQVNKPTLLVACLLLKWLLLHNPQLTLNPKSHCTVQCTPQSLHKCMYHTPKAQCTQFTKCTALTKHCILQWEQCSQSVSQVENCTVDTLVSGHHLKTWTVNSGVQEKMENLLNFPNLEISPTIQSNSRSVGWNPKNNLRLGWE